MRTEKDRSTQRGDDHGRLDVALSIRTIESHRANLMGKLGLSSRVELVTYAEEHGLL
jgi:ATP/maltotriose-dependent transcriptional regulator MalT